MLASHVITVMFVIVAALGTSHGLNLFNRPPASSLKPEISLDQVPNNGLDATGVKVRGMIDYKGNTSKVTSESGTRWATDDISFVPATDQQNFGTRWALWRQLPWKKFRGKAVLKAKIGGSLPLEPSPSGFSFGSVPDFEPVESLQEVITMLNYGAYDPRVKAVVLEIEGLQAGYAKLTELKRFIGLFRASGKKIYAYCSAGSEKELFVALGCDAIYVPPDGGLDLRGFSAAATFVRGVFDKIGIEPQVQRIGKYKSFGDTFNRTEIAEAQREVVSSLLMEASDFWVSKVAESTGLSEESVMQLWKDSGIKSVEDYRDLGYITGVKYLDQVEVIARSENADENKLSGPSMMDKMAMNKYKTAINETMEGVDFTNDTTLYQSALGVVNSEVVSYVDDFSLAADFEKVPRRSLENFTISSAEDEAAFQQRRNDMKNATLKADLIKAKTETAKINKAKSDLDSAKRFFEMKVVSSWPRMLAGGMYLRKMRKGARILKGLRLKEVRSGPRVAIINAVGGIASGKSGNGPTGKSVGSDSIIKLVRRARADPGIKALVLRIDSPGGSALASDLMWRELRALAEEKPVIASQVDVAASGGYYLSMACDAIFSEELTVTGSIGVVTAKFNVEELNAKLGYGTEMISRGRYAEVLTGNRGFTEEEEAYFEEGAQKAYTSFITKAAASRSMSVEDMNEVAQGRVWTGRQALNRGLVDRMGGMWAAIRAAAHLAELDTDRGLAVQTLVEPKGALPIPGVGRSAGVSLLSDDMEYCVDDCVVNSDLVSADSLGVPPALRVFGLGPLAARALQKTGLAAGLIALSEASIYRPPSLKGLLLALEDALDSIFE